VRDVQRRCDVLVIVWLLAIVLAFGGAARAGGGAAPTDPVDGCIVGCATPSERASPAPPSAPTTSIASTSHLSLDAIGEMLRYTVDPFLLSGALIALEIAVASMVAGILLGLGLALLRLSRIRALSGAAWTYIWFVRGTPPLLQLVFLFDALPSFGVKMGIYSTAVLGFALNEAAFSAEIIRGGILSVHRDQSLAAASLGMGPFLTLRRIVMPQAMRAILPGIANDTISVIKRVANLSGAHSAD